MDNFQIETAQNISITQNVAGIGERILAYLIDGLVMLSYILFVSYLLGLMELPAGSQWVYILIIGLPVFLYFLIWETTWNGQSPGKAALNLRVVKLDGTKPAFSSYLIRWLLRIIDITMSSGSVAVVTILLNGKGQRLGDLAAGTTVITEKHRVGIEQTLMVDLPEDYQPKYPQVTVLSDRDVQEIKKLFRESVRNSQYRVIQSLSNRLSELLDVTPEENPQEFIKKVIKDYNYFTGE